jgi:hypothetical protein
MKPIPLITFLLLIITSSSNCIKNGTYQAQLPPETQTGANTLGFKIDGKVYTASGKSGLLSNQYVYGGGPNSDTSIVIRAHNREQKFDLLIKVQYSGTNGIHLTSEYHFTGMLQLNSNGTIPTGNDVYNTNSFYKAKVNIKYCNGSINPLRTGTIVSGTFEMEAINSDGKIIKLTDGRFDISQ